jgi:CBS domain-containing protein
MLRVQQLMSQNVHVCRPDDLVETAARTMWERDVGVVPVVERDGRVMAMLTDRDVCMAALFKALPLNQIRVSQAMSRRLYTVRPEQPIEEAELVLREHQIRRVPVVDGDGRLVGLLSQNDLVNEAARERELRRKEITAVAVTATLADIGRSRAGGIVPAAPAERNGL